MEHQNIIWFNGIKYRLMGAKRYYLSQSTTNEGRRKAKGLHVAIWEYYSGKTVPKGYIVHHKDGDCFNNDYSNLECISISEHNKRHAKEKSERAKTKEQLEHLDKIRELSKEWHKSEAGKEWHRQHVKNSLAKAWAFNEERECAYCGKKYIARTK